MANTSINGCGSSCTACPGGTNATATCDGTSCGLACDPNFLLCGGACAPCGTVPANATRRCNGAACEFACSDGFVPSGAACVPAYSMSTIAAACEVLTAPTELLSTTTSPALSDDSVSTTRALVFPVSFFRAAQTHFSASSNGLMQFHATSGGVGSTEFTNDPIPTLGEPEGLVGPFWDDLNVVAGGTSKVMTQTIGTTPNQKLIVEWFDMRPYSGNGTERLQFQAQIFETTNVIEFHYCSLTPPDGGVDRTTGVSATIGLETATGAGGVQHSYNTAGAAMSSSAVRFTPQ